MAFASLIAAAGLWAFSGNGDKVFHVDANGVERCGVLKNRLYRWTDFERLDREVSEMILHIKPTARGSYGPAKLVFDISKIDCSGPQLEALLVYYRPDLYPPRASRSNRRVIRGGNARPRYGPLRLPHSLLQPINMPIRLRQS